MGYEITFSSGFKDGLAGLPKEIYPIVDRQLARIAEDPYAKNPNATRLKNERGMYRVQIGGHVRMRYKVLSKQNRVAVLSIGPRQNFYRSDCSAGRPLTPSEVEDIRRELKGKEAERQRKPDPKPSGKPAPQPDIQVHVEPENWITEDELFLLHVPGEYWQPILAAGSMKGLPQSGVPEDVRDEIEDYWTNPQPTQIEKLYTLSPGQGAAAIASQPLSHFLIALDPDQKAALEKLRKDGPYLVKGSAGTGKSLVGLYHIRDLIIARAGDSLFDYSESTFGVITYTNTLVDANQSLLRAITPESAHPGIQCSTLDKIVYDLVRFAIGTTPNPINVGAIAKWIRDILTDKLEAPEQMLLERLGVDYVADEIEQVIFGNGLETVADYLKQERPGRKRGLREQERRQLWRIYQAFCRLCEARTVQTFEQSRLIALEYLRDHPEYPRFSVLFVDEAQDFPKIARQLCLELVRDPRNLVLAADTGQSIYTVPSSWRKADPRFNFQRRKPVMLQRSYRATREIGRAIAPLRIDPGDEDDQSSLATPVFSGPKPKWIDSPRAEHVSLVRKELTRLIRDATVPINPCQVAVIVRDNPAAERYLKAIRAAGIGAAVVTKKFALRMDGDTVHIITAHSSKGLGFPVVIVPDLQDDVYPWTYRMETAKDDLQREQIEEWEQRLLYVALSRASHQLLIVADPANPSRFLQKLNRKLHWR